MTNHTISKARLNVYKPGNNDIEPNETIPSGDILSVEITERVQDLNDDATITINNDHAKHTGVITSGDRVTFYIGRSDLGQSLYGDDLYGDGVYGGGLLLTWTGVVRGVEYEKYDAVSGDLTLDCQDFVGGVLAFRTLYNAYENTPIAGTNGAIVNDILTKCAPEVGQDRISTVSETTDLFSYGNNVFDTIGNLAREANCLLASLGEDLVFTPVSELSPEFILTEADVKGSRRVKINDDNLVNDIRVDGGTDKDLEVSHTTVDSYQTVTEGNPITIQTNTRKSRLHTIEVWTRKTGSGEGIVVRLQSDENGSPVDIGNENSDLVREQIGADSDDFVDDGFTKFVLPDHILPESTSWLIIEGDGESGQEIGVNSADGTPAFQTYYPFPVSVKFDDYDSQNEYRHRQATRSNDALVTFQAARSVGETVISHNKLPRRSLEFEPYTDRARKLDPLDCVTANIPDITATGDYVIIEKKTTYEDSRFDITYTAQELATL